MSITRLFQALLSGFAAVPAPLEMNQYRCARCDGVFEKGWTDEEASAELGELFPGSMPSDCDQVCDGCFKEMGFQ